MNAKGLLARCREYYAVLTPEGGDRLVIHSPERLPEDLQQELREHKPEIMALLKDRPPLWHAERIAQAVREEGVCVFWSDVLHEVIAFTKDDTFRKSVPAGFVIYTRGELWELFQDKPKIPPETLRLIHEAKKQGGLISNREAMP